ncbi:hypothetical protein CI109_106664 [Kwoniella shandongensis]|uniref:Adenylate kinase active site lid domain-containing protein n=1 Tax=Kwoniella shandongensis TaxID=1734106 RepID=A0A5M6BT91_9TREE|nr:uncharacterized protein CI109_006402 [Kwoniella shandongensis]KAA5525232.1 hypothetical protein CI109_006402 [Kwoniella shandongensis]
MSLLTLRPHARSLASTAPKRLHRHHLSTSIPRLRPTPSSSNSKDGSTGSTSTSTNTNTSTSTSESLSSASDAIAETFNSLAEKFKKAVQQSRSEQYEGVEEGGLRMLVFGKPGSGKGTLSARLVKDYDIAFVSTGDVLRKEIAAKSEVGRKAEQVVATGGLVSDELMLEIVKTELDRLRGKSWIVDGFPRTLHQGELLDRVLNQENRPLNMIVHLNVPDSVIMARISARWVHLPSGRVYNTTYSAPKVPGKDDVTGEPLSKRPDDTPETFSKRLQAYYESTAPLLQYFAKTYPDSLFSLSGSSSDEVLIAAGLKAPPPVDDTSSDQNYYSLDAPATIFTSSFANAAASILPIPKKTKTKTIDLTAVEKLWPQLQELIEPFGLRRKPEEMKSDEDVGEVRKEADDLRDPSEAEREVGKGKGKGKVA